MPHRTVIDPAARSIKTTVRGERRQFVQYHNVAARESQLTFAVVWDPDNGAMESFSGDSLGTLSQYYEDPDLPGPPVPPKPWIPHAQTLQNEQYQEPNPPPARKVARIGSVREVSLLFSDSDSIISTSETVFTDFDYRDPEDPPVPPRKVNQKTAPITPSSEFTFAALWDPRTGFSTLRNGKLVAVSSIPPRPENRPSKLLFDGLDLTDVDWDTDSDDQDPVPENSPRTPRVVGETASRIPISEPQRLFDYPAQYAEFCDSPDLDSTLADGALNGKPDPYLEDEGFFDTVQAHSDLDTNLPSRFSTTTFYTSTSRYLNADFNSVSTPGANSSHFPLAAQYKLQGPQGPQRPRTPHQPKSQPSLPRLKEFKLHTPVPRLSQVFRARWPKRRPQEEKWVLIDIQPLEKDRK